jgi:molybdenum cofactor biosynthesis enzyme MoaA
MSKISFDRIEFYITNVCNLDCQDCNRFNDYNFTGWQSWADYAEDYRTWSERIDIKHLVLLGGEPLLNPTILDWISGLSKLWSSPLQIFIKWYQTKLCKKFIFDYSRISKLLFLSG